MSDVYAYDAWLEQGDSIKNLPPKSLVKTQIITPLTFSGGTFFH